MVKMYDNDELHRLQKTELQIFKDFADICEKYKISYFALYGTAIGTVRHQGFIPWDDDMDFGMLREDYQRFQKIVGKELGDRYRLSTPTTEKHYCSSVIKLQKRGTKFIPPYAVTSKENLGIHIDIFVFDRLNDDPRLAVRQIRKARLLSMLMFLLAFSKPEIAIDGVLGKILKTACICIHAVLNILPVSQQYLYRKFEKNATKYNQLDTRYYVTFSDTLIAKGRITKKDSFPLISMPFEETQIKMLRDYDRFLTRLYGNYRKLPDEKDRVNHAPVVIDFGDDEF